MDDVQRSFKLFYDPARSVKFVTESEKRLIGNDSAVNFAATANGNNTGRRWTRAK